MHHKSLNNPDRKHHQQWANEELPGDIAYSFLLDDIRNFLLRIGTLRIDLDAAVPDGCELPHELNKTFKRLDALVFLMHHRKQTYIDEQKKAEQEALESNGASPEAQRKSAEHAEGEAGSLSEEGERVQQRTRK